MDGFYGNRDPEGIEASEFPIEIFADFDFGDYPVWDIPSKNGKVV